MLVAHAVFGGAYLEHDIAIAFEMVITEAAFAGGHPAAGHRRPAREGLYCRFGYGAVAHAGNVEDRAAAIGLATLWTEHDFVGFSGFFIKHCEAGVDEQDVALAVVVTRGTERLRVVEILGGAVHP